MVIRQKDEPQNGCFKVFSHVCVSEGKKCSIFGKFDVLCFLETTVVRFALLPLLPTNYASDNAPYVSGKNIEEVVRYLEESSSVIFKWFSENQFQANASKCHVLLTLPVPCISESCIEIKNFSLLCGASEGFMNAFKNLARIAPFMNIHKKKVVMKAFFVAQFSYCE